MSIAWQIALLHMPCSWHVTFDVALSSGLQSPDALLTHTWHADVPPACAVCSCLQNPVATWTWTLALPQVRALSMPRARLDAFVSFLQELMTTSHRPVAWCPMVYCSICQKDTRNRIIMYTVPVLAHVSICLGTCSGV